MNTADTAEYQETNDNINKKDYSKEQLDVWAPEDSLSLDGWKKK